MIEALTSTAIGLVYAFALNMLIAAAYDFPMTAKYSAILTFWMTVASVVRTYIVRRVFEWWPGFWKRLWCKHVYDFVDTTQGGQLTMRCAKCDHTVRDYYPSASE